MKKLATWAAVSLIFLFGIGCVAFPAYLGFINHGWDFAPYSVMLFGLLAFYVFFNIKGWLEMCDK